MGKSFAENRSWSVRAGVTAAILSAAQGNMARAADDKSSDKDGLALSEVVVTAVAAPASKMQSSISISTLDASTLQQLQPASAADVLRSIPGIRSEASGGEGNANVAVRGLPVASGGAKYVQFQEDGLPVLEYGDIAFATPDTFMKVDYNIERVEVVRGGSASTFASNAPGGVINFISKTGGDTLAGNVGVSTGLDYRETRYDFDYGGPISDSWKFHVGGFYRNGEGPRTVDYDAEHGYQLKANMSHDLENGFIRFNVKVLDDRAPVYLPVPVQTSAAGLDAHPSFSSLPGFSVLSGAPQSPYWLRDQAVDASGNRLVTDIADGYHSRVTSFGGELSLELAGNWTLDDSFCIAAISGDFVGPYPQQVDSANTLAAAIGGPGATLSYANGPNAAQAIANPAVLAGNGLAVRYALFNVTLNDMGNAANNFRLSNVFTGPADSKTTVAVGLYQSRQNIQQDWHWNTYLATAAGKDSLLLDVTNAAGVPQTQAGLVAYGVPYWGNCCTRSYDAHYDTTAPYASVTWQTGPWNIDGSLRYDTVRASGSYAGASQSSYDVNGDGVIQTPEQSVSIVNSSKALPIRYSQDYLSWSVGTNYEITHDLAAFARASEGGRANADRLLFGGGINSDGSAVSQVAVNKVRQYEAGVKWRAHELSLFATGFYASTQEQNQDVTQNDTIISRLYHAYGLELEGAWQSEYVVINGGVTYTHSRIVADAITPADVGTTPQRQADLVYQFTPVLILRRFSLGANIIGTTDAFSGQTTLTGARLMQPAYVQVNLFARYDITERLGFSVDVNNVFDAIGITEVDSGPNASGVATARSITGRNARALLRYSF
jgi:outer membrane receptor protein involved in Fe transport